MIQALLTQAEYDECAKKYSTYNPSKRRKAEPFRTIKLNGIEMLCGPPPNYKMGPMSAAEVKKFNDAIIQMRVKAGLPAVW